MGRLSELGCGPVLVAIVTILLLTLAGAYIVMLLWNWLMPLAWPSAPILTVWETWGFLALISIIASIFKK